MRFLLLTLAPLALGISGQAHASQGVSKAIPPEGATTHDVVVKEAVAVVAKPQKAVAMQTAPHTPSSGLAKRSSIAIPPEATVQPIQAVLLASREEPVSKKSVLESAMRQVEDVEEVMSVRQARVAHSNIDGEVRCVAQAVFHEARGESEKGQIAVADVVMNRARSGKWGRSACAVVNAPKQFSNRSSWRSPQPGVAAWDRAISIAQKAVSGFVGVSSRLMNFRASYMGAGGSKPVRIGNHIFW